MAEQDKPPVDYAVPRKSRWASIPLPQKLLILTLIGVTSTILILLVLWLMLAWLISGIKMC